MKTARGILFLLVIVFTASPAFSYPTESDPTESYPAEPYPTEDDAHIEICEDPDSDYETRLKAFNAGNPVENSDDHLDDSEAEADYPEIDLSTDFVDAEETALENTAEEVPETNEVVVAEEQDDRQLTSESSNGTTEATQSGRGRKLKPTRVGGRQTKRRLTRRKQARRRLAHKRKHWANRRRAHKGRKPHRRPFHHRRKVVVRKPVNRGRSSEVEQTNKLIDMILANFSATIGQKPFKEEIKLTAIPEVLKVLPWAYRTISITDEAALLAANHAEDIEADAHNTTDSCADAGDSNGSNSTCIETTSSSAAAELNPEDHEELGPDDQAGDQEAPEEDKPPNDLEKEAEKESGTEADVDEEEEHVYTKDPYPVLKGNDTVEYYVQLLHPKLAIVLDEQQAVNETDDESTSKKLKSEDDDLNEVEPAAEDPIDGRKKRATVRKDSKKPDLFQAVVTGLERVKRSRDVKTVARNSLRIYRIPLSIGPVAVHFKEPVSFAPYNQTWITTEELPALLTIKERDGRLITSRLSNKHATPYLAQVTLRRSPEDQAPDKLDTGRLVTHLSQELARLWNRGLLLSKLNRQFKDLFINKKNPKN